MLYMLFELSINLYESVLMIYFMCQRLDSNTKSPIWIDISFCLCIAACLSVYSFVEISFPDTWIFVFPLIYTFVTHRGTILNRLLCTLILGVIFIVLVGLIPKIYTTLMHLDLESVMLSTPHRIGCVISYNLILTIAVFFFAKIGKTKNKLIPKLFSVFICVIMLFLLIATELIFTMQQKKNSTDVYLILIYVFFLLSTVAIFAFYEAISNYTWRNHSQMLIKSTEEKVTHHSAEMAAYYQRMLVLQHDLHNQINRAGELIASTDYEEYRRWLDDLNRMIDDRNPFITGNMAVDAIITSKRILAQQSNISFDFQPYPLHELPMNELEFCTLLTNILDNAIEGALRVDPAINTNSFLSLRLNQTWDMFYLKCENSCDPKTIKQRDDDFVSSKSDSFHGLGTKSIKQIVSDHEGVCSFTFEGNIFTVSVMLPAEQRVLDAT